MVDSAGMGRLLNDEPERYTGVATTVTRRLRWIAALTAGLFLAAIPGSAQSALVLSSDDSPYRLEPSVEWFIDSDRRWPVEDASPDQLGERFESPVEMGSLPEADPGSAVWARFRIVREDSRQWLLSVSYTALDRICVHWPRTGGYSKTCTGLASPYSTRPVKHPAFIFPVPEDLLDREPVYVYAESSFPVVVPLQVISQEALYDQARDFQLTAGLYYGAIFVIALYNLFIFSVVRDVAYLYYSLHICCMGLALFGFEGLAVEYLWPEIPGLKSAPLLFLGATFVFGSFYARHFLLTQEHSPRIDKSLLAVAILAGSGMAATYFDVRLTMWIEGAAAILFAALLATAAFVRLRDGFRPARFMLVAMSVFLAAVPLVALSTLGVISSDLSRPDILRFSTTLGAVLLSFGLADRVRLLAAERGRLIPELEARNAEMERFIYTVSHDLKTPLITIKGFLGFLEKDTASGDADKARRDIEHIGSAADKMYRLLEELLELSRIGRIANPPERVELSELAREALALVAGRIHERGAVVEVSSELPIVYGDRTRLLEVLQNLLDNALKFMGDQEAPRVEMGTRQDGLGPDAETVCYVRDNGIGIEPRFYDKIFGLFERLDAKEDGTGVGLTLTQRIVEHHGGRIWVESKGQGHGTTFCFTLPRFEEGMP